MTEKCKQTDTPSSSTEHEMVLQSGEAWNGQPYEHYPPGKPLVSVMRMSLPPNTELPWHTHPVPNAAYVLSGRLTIQDKDSGKCHTVQAGEALIETIDRSHRGFTGKKAAEIVIFYAGAEGLKLSVPLPGEAPEF